MIVVVVLISSWYLLSRNDEKCPPTATDTAPCTSHNNTSKMQNAKKGARLAIREARPANRSKKPTRLDTSVGISTASRFVAQLGSSWPYRFEFFITEPYPERDAVHRARSRRRATLSPE